MRLGHVRRRSKDSNFILTELVRERTGMSISLSEGEINFPKKRYTFKIFYENNTACYAICMKL